MIRFLRYIAEEILIVLGTSSSGRRCRASWRSLEHLGCSKPGSVVPTGYSFNLDGTSIYMTMAAISLWRRRAACICLGQELGILASCC